MIDDSNGKFKLEGNVSELTTDNMNIVGSYIDGSYQEINEVIIGDYAKINTLDESYKVSSNKSKNVKILIDNTNE